MDKRTENKRLIEQYPFLLRIETGPTNFEFTELDTMPAGWRTAFGEEICKEIMEELVRNNCVDSYRIVQIKEKYGELRWYSQGGTERIYREIVPKYERMSKRTCIYCGQPATFVSKSWAAPWCNTCAARYPFQELVDIDAFYGLTDDKRE